MGIEPGHLHVEKGRPRPATRVIDGLAGGFVYLQQIVPFLNPPARDVESLRPVELIARHGKATQDYLEYRREVEGTAAEFAALRATEDDKALLTRIIEAMKAAHVKDDFAEEAAIDVEFHNAVGECAHNIILLHTLRSCYRLLSEGVFYNRAMIYNLSGAREKLLAQHVAMYEAIMAHDPAAAKAAAREHMDFVVRAMAEARRTGEWERVSRLRLQQRLPTLGATGKTRKARPSEAAQ